MRWRKDYDRWRENRLWQEDGQAPRIAAIRREAGSVAGLDLLDIGSGMGGFLVAARRNGMNAVGLEPNADYCTITRLRAERYGMRAAVTRGYGEALPFGNASFDVVLAQDILEHVRDPLVTLAEIRRVLRPTGVALVTVINRFAWRDPHYHLYGVNWLPRAAGEATVERVGRSKRAAAFADNQRLSEMYYDTFRGFVARAYEIGFTACDTKERAFADRTAAPAGRYRFVVRLLRRAHLALPVYRAHRLAVAPVYEIALRPARIAR